MQSFYTLLSRNPTREAQICLFLTCISVIILRYPDFLFNPRIWAEELIYLETFLNTNSSHVGFDAIIYPSYYLLSSRLSAFFASQFAVEYAPLVLSICGFLIFLIPLIIIIFSSSSYWKSTSQKIILLIFIIFCCSTGEIWMNSTNTGFILSLTTLLILIDDEINSSTKKIFYSIILMFAFLSGPISLIMSPFLIFRFFAKKERIISYFCLIAFFIGSIHLSYYFISSSLELVSHTNRGHLIDLPLFDRIIYWISSNTVFPILGYLGSKIFRTAILESTYSPELLHQKFESAGISFISSDFISIASSLILALVFIVLILIVFLSIKYLKKFEFFYFMGLFFAVSIIVTYMSLAGQGGFKYSLSTSFLLLLVIKIIQERSKLKFEKIFAFSLLGLSILAGLSEYKFRLVSYTPLNENYFHWPIWENEISIWKKDNSYKPLVWPYLKTGSLIEPKRTDIWKINLNEPETWNNAGRKTYSNEAFKKLTTYEGK